METSQSNTSPKSGLAYVKGRVQCHDPERLNENRESPCLLFLFFDKVCHRDCNFFHINKYTSESVSIVETNLPESWWKQEESKEVMKSSLVSGQFTHLCEKSSKIPTVLTNHSHLLAGCLNLHLQHSRVGNKTFSHCVYTIIQIIPAISVSSSCFQVVYLLDKHQSHHSKSLLFRNFKPSGRAPGEGFEGGQG